jgi:hypothetical protein
MVIHDGESGCVELTPRAARSLAESLLIAADKTHKKNMAIARREQNNG